MAHTISHLDGQGPVSEVKGSVFRRLLLAMVAFGLFIGIIFPPFARVVLRSDRALSPEFIFMCLFAGFVVGLVNFLLFNVVVSQNLSRVVAGMRKVLVSVTEAENAGEGCADECMLEVTSNDAIGEIEVAFNAMTMAIARRLSLEFAARALNTNLSSSVELKEVSTTILDALAHSIGANAGVIYGDTGDAVELLANFGVDWTDRLPHRIGQNHGPVAHALETGEILTLSPREDGLDWVEQSTPLGKFRPGKVLNVPLMVKQRPVGIVLLAGSVSDLTPDQIDTLETLRTHAAPHLQNAILHRKITNLAAIDDLTMILNRRFGLRRLQEEFSRAVRHGIPMSVVMVDVDHFKKFNDDFGHDAGDSVLKMVAATIEKNLRAGDVVCRYGGEEFMVVAPGTGLNDGAIMAERLRRILETSRIQWGSQQLSVTVSMGLATWPMTRVSISEELVTAADKALYTAKESGRNQVVALQGDQVLPIAELKMPEQAPG